MANMEIDMAQDLTSINQDPLFLVFLDLSNSYDTLYDGRLLHILEVYVTGPKFRGILEYFWKNQEVFTQHSGYRGPQFWETRSNTQGGGWY